MWQALLGAAGGAGLGYIDTAIQYNLDRSMQSYATRRARQAYQNRYRWTMHDMREAGLNPILAYQTGVGGGPTTAAGRVQRPDSMQDAQLGMAAAREAAVFKERLKQAKANVWLTSAQENQAVADRNLKWQQYNESQARERESNARSVMLGAQAKATDVQRRLDETKVPGAKHVEELHQTQAGGWLRYMNTISRALQGKEGDR